MYKGRIEFRVAGQNKSLCENGVEALVGNAVAVKDYSVAWLYVESVGGEAERREQNERK
jgi:hypothetical protein